MRILCANILMVIASVGLFLTPIIIFVDEQIGFKIIMSSSIYMWLGYALREFIRIKQ